MKKTNIHEVEDPNAKYYEPKPEGEKNFWKRHLVTKHKNFVHAGDDVFSATNVGKDKTHQFGDPKADLDNPVIGNRPEDELKGEKGVDKASKKKLKEAKKLTAARKQSKKKLKEAKKLTAARKQEREKIVKGMKKHISGFKDRYGDRYKEVMYATATKQAMGEEVEEFEEATKAQAKVSSSISKVKNKQQKEKVGTYDVKSNLQWPIHRVKSNSVNPETDEEETLVHHVRAQDKHAAINKIMLGLNKKGHEVNKVTHHGIVKEAVDNHELDYEGEMVKTQLRAVMYHAKRLHDMLDDNTNLPEWVQLKITLGADYIETAADYMEATMNEEYFAEADNPAGGAAATSDSPGGAQPAAGSVNDVGQHFNNNPTKVKGVMSEAKSLLENIAMQSAELYDELAEDQQLDTDTQQKLRETKGALDEIYETVMNSNSQNSPNVAAPTSKSSEKKEEFEADDYYEIFEEVEDLEEATVKDSSGKIIGTHKPEEGFKPNAEGKRLGHKPHATDVPKGATIARRGRPVGSLSSGASKLRTKVIKKTGEVMHGVSSSEAGGASEKPSFTDQLIRAHGHRDGGRVEFKNGETKQIPKTHAAQALVHFSKPEYAKPADKERLRTYMSSSHKNFIHAMTTGKAPAEIKRDPDAAIKARTKAIVSGRTVRHKELAQKILAKRKAGK